MLLALLGAATAQGKPLAPSDRAFVDATVAKAMEDGRLPGFSIERLSNIAARDCRAWVAEHCDVDVVAAAYERVYRSAVFSHRMRAQAPA